MHRATRIVPVAVVILCAGAAPGGVGDQLHKLLAADGTAGNDFGGSIGVSGTTAVVGADNDNDNGTYSGSAYLFNTATGAQIAKLVPADGAASDFFGISVAISGTTAVVGAHFDDDRGSNSGSVYVFDATTGSQITKLLAADGASNDNFGFAVAIDGTVAVVGAAWDDVSGSSSGSAYVFNAITGAQIAKLVPTDGAAQDYFGRAVAVSGTTAIVGAPWDDDNGDTSGSAYLFDTTTGAQVAKLLPSDGASADYFGYAVAISGTTAIVGAWANDAPVANAGSAYLFDTTTGVQIAKLTAADAVAWDSFGEFVAIDGTTAVVGAPGDDDNGSGSGSAYVFDITTGAQLAKLVPGDGAASDEFGCAVAISGTTAAIGARQDDDNGTDSGSAYVFQAAGFHCLADMTTQGAPLGDARYGVPDGVIGAADISYYVNLWVAGCP